MYLGYTGGWLLKLEMIVPAMSLLSDLIIPDQLKKGGSRLSSATLLETHCSPKLTQTASIHPR
jgi:hypothetical protein